jgi:protein farnesyltransferase/geranylgeranyltransferase type-1 subunit alpha
LLLDDSQTDQIITSNPKNYQVWQHRKCLIERLGHAANELAFTKQMIDKDSKNYHAWQHRQWIVDKFELFDNEIEYMTKLLHDDLRNNSAWNHRYFVLEKAKRLRTSLETEIDFCLSKIKLAPDNESVWNYLRGILDDSKLSDRERVNDVIEKLVSEDQRSRHLIGFQIDLLRDKYKKTGEPELKTRALDLVNQLIVKYDIVRKEYWKFISTQIQEDRA